MKKSVKLLSFLLIICLCASCKKESKNASLSISSKGQQVDSVWIRLYPYDAPDRSNTLKLKFEEGIVNFDTLITTPHFGWVKFPTKLDNGKLEYTFSQHIEFLVKPKENLHFNASFSKDGFNYSIDGNSFNAELRRYNTQIAEETDNIYAIYREIYNRFPNNKYDWTLPGIDSLLQQRKPFRNAIENKKDRFILDNLEYEIAAYLMYYFPKEKVRRLYPLLSEEAKNSTYGKLVEKKMDFWESLEKGAPAPNFSYKTLNDKQISLDQFKGKYVLLEFWGTWCPPCVKEIPELKTFYDSNRDNIEIIGIACNDKHDSWKNFVTKNELNWTQILNDSKKMDLTKTYDVKAFPTKILIDPYGNIVQTFKDSGKETFEQMNRLIKASKSQ